MRPWCLGLVFVAGCYRPATEPPCTVTCDLAGAAACPGDQVCHSDGLCHAASGGCPVQGDASVVDSSIDGLVGPPYCFGKATGSGLFRYCAPALSDVQLSLASFIRTDTGGDCTSFATQASNEVPGVCVIYARTINVPSAGVRVEGPRPLVLVAIESIEVEGVLDVASHVTSMPGAGANPAGCEPLAAAKSSTGGGKGGGAGGTAQGAGGAGGSAGTDGEGAQPKVAVAPGVVRGGCSGDIGVAPNPCTPGRGGGAVYLIAGSSITINNGGKIDASGSGASGGGSSGCGGGAGGMIGFDAPQIVSNGILMAVGGGGSSGNNAGVQGGSDPSSPALGGSGGGNNAGGAGGPGAGGTTLTGFAGASVSQLLNGGGGGGGAGWIVVYGGGSVPFLMNRVGPPPSSP